MAAVQCSKEIDGPKTHRWVVAWRKRCRNKTTHPSGRCHLHRLRQDREPTGMGGGGNG